jgi:hypothetical protein
VPAQRVCGQCRQQKPNHQKSPAVYDSG